jgi:hypothetical protein
VASGLLQHLGGTELAHPGDEPLQLGRLLADPLPDPELPCRRVLHGLARAAGGGGGLLVGVRAAHERKVLRNLGRDRDRGRLWRRQDELVHQSPRQRRHLLVATANALPLAAMPLGLGGGGVAGRETEEVVERSDFQPLRMQNDKDR